MLRYVQVRASVRVRCAHFKRTLYWHWQIITNRWYVVPVPLPMYSTGKYVLWKIGTGAHLRLITCPHSYFFKHCKTVQRCDWNFDLPHLCPSHQFINFHVDDSMKVWSKTNHYSPNHYSPNHNPQIHNFGFWFQPLENQVLMIGWHGYYSTSIITKVSSKNGFGPWLMHTTVPQRK